MVIQSHELARPPMLVLELLEEIGVAEGWFPNLTPAEIAERCASWRVRFVAFLTKDLDDRASDNRPARYEFNASDPSYIQGSCFPAPGDSPELKQAKALRSQHEQYASAIRAISWREFEGVCRGVLSVLGCDSPKLTKERNDQGVDFFGSLSLEGKLGRSIGLPGVDRNFRTWLVGQAKQYEGTVSTTELRELAGSVTLARAGVGSDDGSALLGLDMRVFDPVFFIFITAGSLTADTRLLAKRSGIIALDGESLGALLADAEVGMVDHIFDSGAFDAWVKQQLR
ncbi:restriction endonuclease [Microbacterium immunditiarum]|uniref:Restriction endonuclease type IV Mrr domain-containing protein n=1 Tax=Microbacterium immunditiarum TaxID=337480 RepID=A0A7Y9GN85_9MICO|nr:hypothetical protein [Microbacterium immunditiarum]